MKILNTIIEIITSPFTILLRANAMPDPNKKVKPLLVLFISLIIVAVLILLIYREVIFQWFY